LLPVFRLGFADVIYADRFLYLPSFGFVVLLVLLGREAVVRGRNRLLVRVGTATAVVVCLAVYLAVLRLHMPVWRNGVTLFSHAAQTSPSSAYVYQNLGRALTKAGEYDRALEAYGRAKALQSNEGVMSMNEAAVYEKMGDFEKARELYEEALKLGFADHGLHFNLANTLSRLGHVGAAVQHYERSLAIRETPRAHANLGNLYFSHGELEKAWDHYQAAAALEPSRVVYNNMGAVRQQQRRFTDAIPYFERAIALEPGAPSPHLNLADVLFQTGDFRGTVVHARRALTLLEGEGGPPDKVQRARRLLAEAQKKVTESALGSRRDGTTD
jgi:tetratricopeptide (TPR) repeat protein